jgi:hypothetical protein
MVGGLGAVGGLLRGRGRLYEEMLRHIGDDAMIDFLLMRSAFLLLSRFCFTFFFFMS